MKKENVKILVADDDDSLRRVLVFQLQESGFDVTPAENGAEAWRLFSESEFDCVITDWRMPQMSGLEFIQRAGAIQFETPIIVITAFGDVETAVEAMRSGAFDFITKPFDRRAILLTIEKALKFGNVFAENRRLRRIVHEEFKLENVIGSAPKMLKVLEAVERVAQTDVTVLIEGESGTGKELIAKGIHFSGKRSQKPFVAINCAAIPENLIEAELFGYKKGAFTGAERESKGKFEEAANGTLFLDEIGAMPSALQTRLLRVLQEKEITRLGENSARKIDVRIIAATNDNLAELIKTNEFREDLYYRLAVVPIKLPALRERREDIPLLIEHFLGSLSRKYNINSPKLDREVFKTFYEHTWLGNIRELENTIERMIILSGKETISLADVPEHIKDSGGFSDNLWFTLPVNPIKLEKLERDIIEEALARFNGNQTQTARYLGITRSALIYRMQKHDVG